MHANVAWAELVFLSPVLFGLAHLHHMVELYRQGRGSFVEIVASTAFQFMYTTLFGWYAAWLFVKTHCFWAPAVAHMFCNWMGFPDVEVLVSHPKAVLLRTLYATGVVIFSYLVFIRH